MFSDDESMPEDHLEMDIDIDGNNPANNPANSQGQANGDGSGTSNDQNHGEEQNSGEAGEAGGVSNGNGNNDDEMEAGEVFTQATQASQAASARAGRPELIEGINYRLIQGQRGASKLIINNNYSYLVEKHDFIEGGTRLVFYIKCRHKSCSARGTIKAGVLELSRGKDVHTCERVEGQSSEAIVVQELLTSMKKRAAREGSSYRVSMLILRNFCY